MVVGTLKSAFSFLISAVVHELQLVQELTRTLNPAVLRLLALASFDPRSLARYTHETGTELPLPARALLLRRCGSSKVSNPRFLLSYPLPLLFFVPPISTLPFAFPNTLVRPV